jgi:hypothetical protein
METIWYCYRKDNGEFAGSGTPYIDNDEHGSTEIPCVDYYGLLPIFDGENWTITLSDKDNPSIVI